MWRRLRASLFINGFQRTISNHIDNNFMLRCIRCGSNNAHIYKSSKTQNSDGKWERWIKGVFHYGNDDYHPYVFLISHNNPDSEIDSIQINYYKDYSKRGGSLKHGHGPGGTPVVAINDFTSIGERLKSLGLI